MKRMKSTIYFGNIIISICFGVFITLFCLFVKLGYGEKSTNQMIFIGGFLFIVFSVISYWAVFIFIFPKLRQLGYQENSLLIFLLGSIIIGCYLYFAIPISITSPNKQSLKIITKGEKNPHALGNEVRLIGITQGLNNLIGFEKLQKNGDWQEINGQLLSHLTKKSTINWSTFTAQPITLTFIAHPWSGLVKIIWNGHAQTVDLYNVSSTTFSIQLEPQRSNNRWISICMFVSTGITIGLIVLFLSTIILIYSRPIHSRDKQNNSPWWLYSIPMMISWIIYLLAFWPGIMISDSFDQWNQMVTGIVNDHHPAFHTFYLWLITRIWYSPASVALFQITLFSLVIAYGLSTLVKNGVNNNLAWLASVLIAISPMNALMVINLWKDTIYSIMFIVLSIIFLLIFFSKGKWLNSTQNIILFSIIEVLISLFRHNGFPIALGSLLILLIVYRQQFRQIIFAMLISTSLYFLIICPIYKYFNVYPVQPILSDAIQFHHIAAHLKADTNFTPEELSFLNSIRQTDDDWEYNCYNVNPTVFSDKINPSYVAGKTNFLNEILIRAFMRNPIVNIKHIVCASSLLWRVKIPKDGFMDAVAITYNNTKISTFHPATEEQRNEIWEQSKFPEIEKILTKYIFFTLQSKTVFFLWRPAFYLYFCFLGLILFMIKNKNRELLVITIPFFLQFGMLILVTFHQSLRYAYPIILYFMLFWPLLFSFKSHNRQDIS